MDFATVILQPAGVYTTTDKDGCYAQEGLDEGTYEIQIQFIGYQTIDSTLFIKGRQSSIPVISLINAGSTPADCIFLAISSDRALLPSVRPSFRA